METVSATVSASKQKYHYNWVTNEVLEWVRDAATESDAVHNLKVILESYERRKSFWEKFKCLLN